MNNLSKIITTFLCFFTIILTPSTTPENSLLVEKQRNKNSQMLVAAVQKGNRREVQRIIAEGINPNWSNDCGRHALYYAQSPQIAQPLIDVFQLDAQDIYGITPLHNIVVQDNYEVAQVFLQAGASPNIVDNHGYGPVHRLRSSGMGRLLLRNKVNIDIVNEYGQTPMHTASMRKDHAVVDFLLRKETGGKGQIHKKDKQGFTPLHVTSSVVIMNYFFKAGADFDARNGKMWTPLHHAVRHCYLHPERKSDNSLDVSVVNKLMDHGADKSLLNDRNQTALNLVESLDFEAIDKMKLIQCFHGFKK